MADKIENGNDSGDVNDKTTPKASKPEAPKPEASKPEAPKSEAPKSEAPKSEAPKPEFASIPVEADASPVNSAWDEFIGPFAIALGVSPNSIARDLKDLVGEPGDEAIKLLQNEEFTPFEDIRQAFGGRAPLARLRKAVADIRKSEEVEVAETVQMQQPSLSILPDVPSDESFLQTLKTGGVLRVNKTTVISAVRAGLAKSCGLYEIPTKLVRLMEDFAETMEESVGIEFFDLRDLLTRRVYSDIFAAMPGIKGSFVTEGRKNAFLDKLDENLWITLINFQEQLKAWMDSWQQGMNNPGAMMTAFAALAGGSGLAMPPGMMAPPATDTLKDAAESVNDRINRIFAGVGVPIALALAYDAQNIKSVLDNSTLPGQIGAPNRDQMLKILKVNVSADYVRLEQNVTKYLLGIMNYPNVEAGQTDLQYLGALFMLGSQIPWNLLQDGTTDSERKSSRV